MIGMYSYINFNSFVDGFYKVGRGNCFSYDALEKLFGYFEDFSEELGEPLEFDPIAICCDWVESSEDEIIDYYILCEKEDLRGFLENNTIFFELDNGNMLYQQF